MVEVNRSGLGGSISLVVIGIILILAALVFYFIKNVNYFAITIIIIGIITIILGAFIIFYTTREIKRQKLKALSAASSSDVIDDDTVVTKKSDLLKNKFDDVVMLSVVKGSVPRTFNAEAIDRSSCVYVK